MKYNNIAPSPPKCASLVLAITAMAGMAHGAVVTMTGTGDSAGVSSFLLGTNWNGGSPPSSGNTYSVAQNQILRTPADASTSLIFGGDSLTLNGNGAVADGRLLYKGTAGAAIQTTITVSNLILNGGSIENATNTNGSSMIIAGGVVNVTAPSSIMRSSMNGPVVISSTLTGNGTLTVGGQSANNANVTFSGVNTYTGNIVVTNTGGAGLILGALGSFNFAIGLSGVNNGISGTGAGSATFDGSFVMDLTNAAPTGAWNIVSAASIAEVYGGTFAVKDQLGNTWTQSNDIWTSPTGTYQFVESTGVLASIPEPSSLLLGALCLPALLGRRRRVA